jgi:dihydroorotate dehydrogenase (fumarate)
MDLTTKYLGLQLLNPFIAGASPLTMRTDSLKRLEDAGAAAVVLPTLFEEHMQGEQLSINNSVDIPAQSFAESLSYFFDYDKPLAGSHDYLESIQKAKTHIGIPVIASLNCLTMRAWKKYSAEIESAGADALELDFFYVAVDALESGETIERRDVEIIREVRNTIHIPVTVKLTPFHTSLAHFARELATAGANGLVLLHRFYEPDIDIEELELVSDLEPSNPRELLLRLRWLAIISGQVNCSLAAMGGVHTAVDVLKAIMAGANAVQIVSALVSHGPEYIRKLTEEISRWMEEHEYESLGQMCGSMNISRCPDPVALSRGHYRALLKSWQTDHVVLRILEFINKEIS